MQGLGADKPATTARCGDTDLTAERISMPAIRKRPTKKNQPGQTGELCPIVVKGLITRENAALTAKPLQLSERCTTSSLTCRTTDSIPDSRFTFSETARIFFWNASSQTRSSASLIAFPLKSVDESKATPSP